MNKRKSPFHAVRSQKKRAAKPGAKRQRHAGRDEIKRSAPFGKATERAVSCAKDSDSLRKLLLEAREKINQIPRGPFAETWPYLMAMIRLIRAYHEGEYRDIASQKFHLIVAAVLYFVSPFDLIPDSVPVFGHLDDALVVRLAMRSVGTDLDTFMAWETSRV